MTSSHRAVMILTMCAGATIGATAQKPGTLDGQPVPMIVSVELTFPLK